MTKAINIIFDGQPGMPGPRFVEIQDDDGRSLKVGEWLKRKDGYCELRITELPDQDEGK